MEKNNLNKNITWLSWFVGFFEGDGNFQINSKYSAKQVQSTEMLIDKENFASLGAEAKGGAIGIKMKRKDL
jgi:hypothetical protein